MGNYLFNIKFLKYKYESIRRKERNFERNN